MNKSLCTAIRSLLLPLLNSIGLKISGIIRPILRWDLSAGQFPSRCFREGIETWIPCIVVIKWSASWGEEVYKLVKILKTMAPDVQDSTKLYELVQGNKVDWYQKALKRLHSSLVASIQNISRSEERLHWVSFWKVSGKRESLPQLLSSWPSRCWMNLLVAEPRMTGDRQRTIKRGTWEDANSSIPLPALSLVSHMKTRSKAWTLAFSLMGSTFRHHP